MDYIELFENRAEDVIDAIGTAQGWTVSAVERVGKTVGKVLPKNAPVGLGRTRDVAESAFRVWELFLENQRQFTLKLIDAVETAAPRHKKEKAAA
jgi:hypothetical protein